MRMLAIATDRTRAYAFRTRSPARTSTSTDDIAPQRRSSRHCAGDDWAGAAVAAANGLNTPTSTGVGMSWFGLLVVRCDHRRRRSCCCGCGRGAVGASGGRPSSPRARRVDPADPNALASVPIDALDDLSKSIVVDVDNAVRTSDNELALAVEEFGDTRRPTPFSRAVTNARTTLAQAFNVRQILDDAVPETPQQRRDSADPGGRRGGEGRPASSMPSGKRSSSCAIW